MANLSVVKFAAYILSVCSKSLIVASTVILRLKKKWVKLRANLTDESFVDVSYNEKTGKTTFAQIRDERRIFGADNKQGWHWHPYEDPERHDFVDDEITFEEFMKRVEEKIKAETK